LPDRSALEIVKSLLENFPLAPRFNGLGGLLNVIREAPRSGRRLHACFACSYFSALRPEEAVNLRRADITIPELVWDAKHRKHVPAVNDWGEFSLRRSAPHAGKEWTDSGLARDDRGLKHRPEGEERIVPIPPELTAILREHLDKFPPDAEGRLFYGERGGPIPVITYNRVWQKARAVAFTPEVLATPLAETPYTLAARGGVDVACGRRGGHAGSGVGGALGRGAAQGLRQVPARAGQRSSDRDGQVLPVAAAGGRQRVFGTHSAQLVGLGRFRPDTAGQYKIGPSPGCAW
jgi:hypothetical protein